MEENKSTATDAVNEETSSDETLNEQTTLENENVVDFEEKSQENKIEKELEEMKDKYTRLQAEYANFMRRTKEEKESIGLFANEKILNELIPVLDSLEMALKAFDDKESNIYKGVELVYKNLSNTLTKFGVTEIEAENADFDPNLHLAVMQEAVEGVEANKVVEVMQKGYTLGKKVLRASMVKVSC